MKGHWSKTTEATAFRCYVESDPSAAVGGRAGFSECQEGYRQGHFGAPEQRRSSPAASFAKVML